MRSERRMVSGEKCAYNYESRKGSFSDRTYMEVEKGQFSDKEGGQRAEVIVTVYVELCIGSFYSKPYEISILVNPSSERT